MEKKKDIRLNKDYRTAYIKDFRRFLESKTITQSMKHFCQLKLCVRLGFEAHKTAKEVVTRLYKPVDVADLKRLQKKYNTIDATGKDSCFYFAVVDNNGKKVKVLDEYNDEVDKSKNISALN
ncbi:MAG: hypothetical protein CM15mV121_050 [uncultured marine virus]|nr:MAG: hypothetical protein CM15mV121_050 [uncultured marine virus]